MKMPYNSTKIIVGIALVMLVFFAVGVPLAGEENGNNAGKSADAGKNGKTLHLEDCVRIALAQNKDYLMAKKDVESKEASERAAYAAMLPSFNLSGGYTMLDPQTVDDSKTLIPAGTMGNPEDIEMQGAYTHNWSASLGLQYAVPWIPFFSDGGWGRANKAHEIAERNLIIARKKLDKIRMDVKASVTKKFYGLLIARKLLDVTEGNEKRVKAYLEVAEKNFDAGRTSQYDVLRSKVQVANIKPQVLQARNRLRLARVALLQVMAMDLDTNIDVKGKLESEIYTVEEAEALKKAFANRSELEELKLTVEILEYQAKLEAAGYRPTFAVFGNYNVDYKKSGGGMFATGEREFVGSWNVGAQISIPLSELLFPWSGSHNKTEAAELNAEKMQMQLDKTKDLIRLEIRRGVLNLDEQSKQIVAQEEAIELSKEGLRIANVRFNNGQMSNVELMDAELDYQQAQLNYYQAWYNYITAKIDVQKAMGVY